MLCVVRQYCLACHRPSNYRKWTRSDRSYTVAYQEGYEPYVVVEAADVHAYDERFVGRGWDKVGTHTHTSSSRWVGSLFDGS